MPMVSGTMSGQIGAMTTEAQVRIIEDQLADALGKGAEVHVGGARREGGKGRFFTPTIITGITPRMKIWQQETFGPVLPIVPFETPEEAVQMANSTPYGLSGSVFSQDMEEARYYARHMETGSVNINDCLVTYALPTLPFGGAKNSGVSHYHGKTGIRNFCRIKSMTEFRGLYSREFFYYPLDAKAKEGIEAVLIFLFSQNKLARLKSLPRAGSVIGGLVREAVGKAISKKDASR